MSNDFYLPLSADKKEKNLANSSVFFIGTAIVSIRYAGFTILTDPNFLHVCDYIRLGYELTSEHLTKPAININSFPIHYNDYNIFKSPPEHFKVTVGKAGPGKKTIHLAHG